jgi:phosphate transport system permease protein
MSETLKSIRPNQAAAEFKPLLLSPAQDFAGWMLAHLGRFLLFAITCTSVISVLLIFFFVIQKSTGFFFRGENFTSFFANIKEFLTNSGWYPEAVKPQFGALAIIVGSVYVTIAALIIAVPIGITAAVFLSDIVDYKIGVYIKPVIELLAAIPSVAYGFFAVLVFAPYMQNTLGFTTGTNALNASIILAIMALPTIISVAEDSLSSVGRELREASYGLGATRFETIFKVLIPASHSGIIAAVILGMMRAIGETMVVWMAAGNASQIPHPWWNLAQSVRTMTATIAGDMGEAPEGSLHRQSLFAIGVLLLIMTFAMNILSEYFLNKAKRTAQGKK